MNAIPGTDAPSTRLVTLPNLLSITRVLLVIPFSLVMLSSLSTARLWACIIIIVAAITDKFDGDLARRLHVESEWGRILDPLADKVGVAVVAVVLLLRGEIPPWYVAALLGRDLLIASGGMYIKARSGVVLPSNMMGKWSFGIIGLTLFLIIAGAPQVAVTVLLWVTIVMLVVSLAMYARRFVDVVSRLPGPGI